MADHCIARIRTLRAVAPERPWVAYYAPCTAHAPHHAPKELIEKFKGRFDYGWDKQRELTFENQKKMGIIPADAQLTPRPANIAAWDSFDADHKKVFAHMIGTIVLSVDGEAVAEGLVERTLPMRVSLDETFDVGEDAGTPVSEDYHVPFEFTGTLNKVVVTLGESKLSAEDEKAFDDAQVKIGLEQ
jgi:hypothetical protein